MITRDNYVSVLMLGVLILSAVYLAMSGERESKPPPRELTSGPVDGYILVRNGNNIEIEGQEVHLLGFETPETNERARCFDEFERGEEAKNRLDDILRSAWRTNRSPKLTLVPCACPPGAEGTKECNDVRKCGVLTIFEENVSDVLIREGLARPHVCGPASCPPRESWCGPNLPPWQRRVRTRE
jgi:hypothetical protein